jgi:hypothetical protein
MAGYNPTNPGWGAASNVKRKKTPTYTPPNNYMAGTGFGYSGKPDTSPSPWDDPDYDTPGPSSGRIGNAGGILFDFPGMEGEGGWNDPNFSQPNYEANFPGATGQGKGRINVMGVPDYRGILDKYTSDWRARINQGLQAMNAQRLGSAKGLINRMGVRDPNAMFAKLGKFGLTLEDLQAAADNPFSELKAIDRNAEVGRGQGLAQMSARGGLRSGGSAFLTEEVENERARSEALASEESLRGLAEGEAQVANWGQMQEDQLAQRTFDLDQSLSQRYQPQVAEWDDSQGGYRWGNTVYDQNGQIIRRL